jgi:DNA polymerase III epsilon subunit-like protein
MRVLFFDTETNGLPWNRHASYANYENWPRVLQLAWQVWEIDVGKPGVCVNVTNSYIKPDPAMKWDTDAAKIHTLSYDRLASEGQPLYRVLKWFVRDVKGCDMTVAHNMRFDKMAIFAECMRFCEEEGLKEFHPTRWWPTNELCTMNATTPICKIPGKNPTPEDPYKWPRLSEVYQFLFPSEALPTNLHDANVDVRCLVKCFQELVNRRLLVLPAIPTDRVDRLVEALRALSF